jgi:single-strand DNA-binding protein
MARSINKVLLIGRLGTDPELKYTPSGTAVTSFRLATTRYSKGADGLAHEDVEWHAIVAWDKLAETCTQFLSKGRLVYVEGRLQTRSWDGPDGQKYYRTEVVIHEMQMLDSRAPEAPPRVDSASSGLAENAGADLPF